MKSLYESILDSTKSGKVGYTKRLIRSLLFADKKDSDNDAALNNEWKKLSLGYDAGSGEGVWKGERDSRSYSYIVKFLRIRELEKYAYAYTNPGDNNTLIIPMQPGQKRDLEKWAEKIARVLNLKIEYAGNYIYLKFE